VRQANSELRQALRDAEELRQSLTRDRDLTRNLDQALNALRQIDPNLSRDDVATAKLLREQVIDPLRGIETELAGRLQARSGKNQLRLVDEGAPPDRYRRLVDEYYRRLSSGR
ncbi:MAG: hypothetical protein EBZ36_13190, partial [Acidobacteria bacterium]|nr:hypothetical protein [Acidobacteriota bacterium]